MRECVCTFRTNSLNSYGSVSKSFSGEREKPAYRDIVCGSLAHSLISMRMCRFSSMCVRPPVKVRERTMNKYHLITRDMICKAENMCIGLFCLASNDWNHRDAKDSISQFSHILLIFAVCYCYCRLFRKFQLVFLFVSFCN